MRKPRILAMLIGTALFTTCVLSTAAQAVDINGSGSTFVYPLMLRWAATYNAKTDVRVNYQGIGSGGGIRQIKAGAVAFGASDKPLPHDELEAAGLAQFPVVIGGVVPVVNLDGIKPGQLNFTGDVLADVFMGKVTSWNDPVIAALNPGVALPDRPIVVAHRSDSSGTTFNWVNYLSKVSPEWKTKVGEGATVNWPTGTAGYGNEGVARYVTYVKGAIGYVELAYALDHKMTFTNLRNKNGVFVTPSLASFQAAADNAQWKAPDFYEILTEAQGDESWPITATTFVLIPKQAKDPSQSAEALKFFRWSLEEGKAEAKALNYVALPPTLVKRVEDYLSKNVK